MSEIDDLIHENTRLAMRISQLAEVVEGASPSYRKADCCNGADCEWLGVFADELCWGPTVFVSEKAGGGYIHACRGHIDAFRHDDEYRKESGR